MEGSAIRPARLFCHCDAEGKRGRISRIMKTTTLASIHSVNRRAYQRILLLIPLVLAYFALSPQARATCQEGCFTTNNTVLGENALLNNTGSNNTGIGFNALLLLLCLPKATADLPACQNKNCGTGASPARLGLGKGASPIMFI